MRRLGGPALAPLAGPLQTPHERGPIQKFVRFLRSPRGSQGGAIPPCSPQYTPRIATGRGAPHRRRSCTYRSLPLPRQVEPRFFPTSYLLDAFLRLDEKGIVKPGESKKGLEMGDPGPTPTPNVGHLIQNLKIPQTKQKDGVATSRRRALDAALVLDYLVTHDARVLCDRDTTPTCPHAVQSVCPQVQCGVHTSTATFMFGLAQLSTREDKKQVSNAGDINSASSRRRTT